MTQYQELLMWLNFLLAYLIGSIPFAFIIARKQGIKDIRQHGSGNVGATNVLRTAGTKAGLLAFILDFTKGVVATYIPLLLNITPPEPLDPLAFRILTGLIAVLGHIFPIWLNFKGGKGVATTLGILIATLPLAGLATIIMALLIILTTRYVSLGSILSTWALPFFVIMIYGTSVSPFVRFFITFIPLIIMLTHISNIKRLLKGTENQISFGKKKQD
ncbi:MAG: glycerol-3-phosphate 1-O-acyltransferase PlsY [Chlorobi bacterium]|nr:glycerol-3-phosphate 1-O-acyltransferase PlsY [Chlorobiota bacterium]